MRPQCTCFYRLGPTLHLAYLRALTRHWPTVCLTSRTTAVPLAAPQDNVLTCSPTSFLRGASTVRSISLSHRCRMLSPPCKLWEKRKVRALTEIAHSTHQMSALNATFPIFSVRLSNPGPLLEEGDPVTIISVSKSDPRVDESKIPDDLREGPAEDFCLWVCNDRLTL